MDFTGYGRVRQVGNSIGKEWIRREGADSNPRFRGMKDRERRKTEELLDAFPVLEIDASVGAGAGDILRRYAPSHGVTLADALIAGTVMCHRMKLWTMNRKQYPAMGG